MKEKKLILPAEVKVCATCSYWDGERQVDEELALVVVPEEVHGECLLHGDQCNGLSDVRTMQNCAWESLESDATEDVAAAGGSGSSKA